MIEMEHLQPVWFQKTFPVFNFNYKTSTLFSLFPVFHDFVNVTVSFTKF